MKWYVVVLFMDYVEYPIYVFTEPTFNTKEECILSLNNETEIPKYLNHLFLEFGQPMPIKGVNCINDDLYKELVRGVSL